MPNPACTLYIMADSPNERCSPWGHRWKFPVAGDEEVTCLECGLSFSLETWDYMPLACLAGTQSLAFRDALIAAYKAANP